MLFYLFAYLVQFLGADGNRFVCVFGLAYDPVLVLGKVQPLAVPAFKDHVHEHGLNAVGPAVAHETYIGVETALQPVGVLQGAVVDGFLDAVDAGSDGSVTDVQSVGEDDASAEFYAMPNGLYIEFFRMQRESETLQGGE